MRLATSSPLKRSFWLESAEPTLAVSDPLQGDHEYDVAIIGGGFVGLWSALTLKEKEPDIRIAILEQDVCGGGASGRNGGFVMSWWPKIGTLKSFCTQEQALFLGRSAERAIYELGEFCEQHKIDAHFHQKGWLWTATTPDHINTWKGTLDACARLGVAPFELLSSAEVARRTGSSIHLAGVIEKSNATVQPGALVRGMRRVALDQGIKIYEKSGVVNITPGNVVKVETERGSVSARAVILANNAWAASLPELAKLIVPVNSSIVVTEPMASTLDNIGWNGREAITDSQLMVDYYRTTNDGRIAFGKGTGAISYGSKIGEVFSADPASIALTEADLRRTYPMLGNKMITHSWSGPIDRTYDSLPIFGSLQGCPNIHYGIGWSGNGVGPSRLGGRILASLALGIKDEWSTCALVGRSYRTFPGEPFRYVGGSMVRNAVIRKEKAEMAGEHPSIIDKILAKLAPAGLEDKS
ncbi:Gamma-glutamylputrescine oxidoreductase [compost metagenome]